MADNISSLDGFAQKYGLKSGVSAPQAPTGQPKPPVAPSKAFGEQLVQSTRNNILSLNDTNEYGKAFAFDSSPTGAFKERYKAFGQKTYDRIGFDPLINNELNYNKGTTTGDEMKRWLTSAALPMVGLGFMDPLRSYKDIATGKAFAANTESAKDYEYYNMLGYSSRGGVGGFGVNLLNSFSYSAGIMIEGAVEGAVIGGAVGLAEGGVGAIPGAVVGGLFGGLKNAWKIPGALYKTAKTISKLGKAIDGLTAVNSAKTFWNGAKSAATTLGKGLNPLENTVEAVTKLGEWKNVDNLTGLARSSRTAGAFWHDMMAMNLALSEGKLEGGMSEESQFNKLYNNFVDRYNKAPDEKTTLGMMKTAKAAGTTNTISNTALVFYSNKIAFPSITKAKFLKGLPSLNAGKVVGTVGKEFQLVMNNADDIAKASMEKVPINFKNSLKAITNPRKMGAGAINYFKANLIEGFQEVGQEALSAAVEDYYTKAFYDPSVKSYRFAMSALADGLSEQSVFSETFLSGFAMGSLLQGPSKLVKHGSRLGNKIFKSKDSYDTYIKQKDAEADQIVNAFNGLLANPEKMFDPRINNYATISALARNVNEPDEQTTKKLKDASSAAFISDVTTSLRAGTFDMYIDQMQKYKNASPQEIEEAWGLQKGEGTKALENLDKAILSAKTIKNRYDYAYRKFKPQLSTQNLKKDSEEYKKAMIYQMAHQEGINSFVFLQSNFDDTLKRLDKLYGSLSKLSSISGNSFSNFSILTNNENKLNREVEMLKSDIELGAKSGDPQTQQEIEQKRKLLSSLYRFQQTQQEVSQILGINMFVGAFGTPEEKAQVQESGSDISPELRQEYADTFKNVLDAIAGSNENRIKLQNEIDENGGFEELFDSLYDTHLLVKDKNILSDYINILADPKEFNEHVERNFQWMKNMYDNRKDYVKDIVNQEFANAEKNEVLNELASKGIYVDLDKFADWVEDQKNIPDEFIDTTNNMIINENSVLYGEYAEIFMRASNAMAKKPAGEPMTDKQKLDDRLNDLKAAKEAEVKEAREVYEQQFADEVGRSLSEVEQENSAITSANAELEENKKKADAEVKLLTNALEAIAENDAKKILKAVDELVSQNILTEEELNTLLSLDANDPAVLQELQAIILKINAPGLTKEDLFKAGLSIMSLPEFLAESINTKKQVLNQEPGEVFDVESSKAFNVYSEKVEQINKEFEASEKEVEEAFAAKGVDKNTVDEITVNTPYDQMPDELKVQLDTAFDKFLEEIGDKASLKEVNLAEYESRRERWLESPQSGAREIIKTYNEKAFAESKARAEKLKEPPFLKYNKKQVTSEDTLFGLNQLYKQLKRLFDTGKDADGKEVKLSAQQKADLKEDLENLQGYLDAMVKTYKPKSIAQKVVDTIVERIVNRRDEVEDVFDESGKKTRKFAGETIPTNATTEVLEKIEKVFNGPKVYGNTVSSDKTMQEAEKDVYNNSVEITLNENNAQEGSMSILSSFKQAFAMVIDGDFDNFFNRKQTEITSSKGFVYKIKPAIVTKNAAGNWVIKEKGLVVASSTPLTALEIEKLAGQQETKTEETTTDTEESAKLQRVTEIANKVAEDKTGKSWTGYNRKDFYADTFAEILENETDPQKAVDIFMDKFKLLAKRSKAFNSKSKIERIEADLRKNPTVDGVRETIDKFAFIESSEAGTKVDELIRKFLTIDAGNGEGFAEVKYTGSIDINGVEYKVSEFMSEKAFNRLFGPGGIVSSIRSKMIDGEFVYFPENILVFDKTLGITGEIDLLAVNAKGEVMIIDIKTSKNWEGYESENSFNRVKHQAQLSIYATLFYNMTGIKVSKLQILPLGISVNTEGYVNDIDKAQVTVKDAEGNDVVNKDGSTAKKVLAPGYYELPFLDDISEYGVMMIKPEIIEEETEEEDGDTGTEESQAASDVLEETEDFEKISLTDLLNKTIMFNGSTGKLIMLEDGSFAVEKNTVKDEALLKQMIGQFQSDLETETDPEIREQLEKAKADTEALLGKPEKEIEVLYHNFKPATNGSLNSMELGISVITGITFPFQTNKVNGKVIKAKFTNTDETKATINGVEYDVVRDKSGSIVAISYRRNDKIISEIDEEIVYALNEIKRLSQLVKPKDIKRSKVSQFYLLNEISQLKDRVTRLEKEKQDLLNTNDVVFQKGGNANDYIFALNSLPNSFQKATKSFKPQDEKKHLKEMDRLSLSAAVSKAITQILDTEEYPETLDILFEVGVQGIAISELDYIYKWIDQKVDELYNLGESVINRGGLVDDISNQINSLLQLKNDLNLIKIIKDGKTKKPRFSKQQAAANKVFGTKEVQKRSGVPKNEKPSNRQAETVPGLSEQGEGIPTEDELKQIVSSARSKKPSLTAVKKEKELGENPSFFEAINKAKDKGELDKAFENAINNRGDISYTTIQEAYKKREQELLNVSADTIKKGTLLISKKPIFEGAENSVVEVFMINKDTNQVVVKLYGTATRQVFTEQEIKDNFTMYSKEAMEKEKVGKAPVTEEDKEFSKESHDNLEKFSNAKDKIIKLESEAEDEEEDNIFKNLKDNSKYC